jgi:hypothetical protein
MQNLNAGVSGNRGNMLFRRTSSAAASVVDNPKPCWATGRVATTHDSTRFWGTM